MQLADNSGAYFSWLWGVNGGTGCREGYVRNGQDHSYTNRSAVSPSPGVRSETTEIARPCYY